MSSEIPKGTLTQLFFDAIARYDGQPAAMRYKAGGVWHPITHRELLERVRRVALALKRLGVLRGDRVALLSENRPEWAIADYACLCLGAADVPVYPTLPAKQVQYILSDAGAVAVFVSSAAQLAKIAEIRGSLPELRHVVVFDADVTGATPFSELMASGAAAEAAGEEGGARFKAEALAARPGDLATLIYTSGTTGEPKGVMLTHDNLYSNVQAALQIFPLGAEDECLSFLPLSHIFERMAGHYTMLQAGAVINYAESIDTVPQNLAEVRPTVMLSVPRLYEKMYARVLENALAAGGAKKRIFFWAKRVAERWADYRLARAEPPGLLGFQYRIGQRLVFSKIKQRTGGRLRFFVSGGAPLAPEIAKFFYAAGLPILEGYGLTETSPCIAANTLTRLKIGTVGPPFPGVEVRIAEDGEILTRGRHVMVGYFNKPEATREALELDGWFHTGDIGELDGDGFLKITDRKKDLIVTAGGKNVAPQPIENLAKGSKYVSNAVMLGDRRKFCIMLVVPNYEHLEPWAKRKGLMFVDRRGLIGLEEVKAKMEREVFRALEGLASYETPKKVLLVERDFTIEAGELTPTLKVRRRVVERKYQAEIEALYAE